MVADKMRPTTTDVTTMRAGSPRRARPRLPGRQTDHRGHEDYTAGETNQTPNSMTSTRAASIDHCPAFLFAHAGCPMDSWHTSALPLRPCGSVRGEFAEVSVATAWIPDDTVSATNARLAYRRHAGVE